MFRFCALLLLFHLALYADEVAVLETAQDRAQARIDTLREAGEIFEVVYLLNEDKVGLAKLALLREKARQGTKVQLLVDALGNGLSPSMITHLTSDPELAGRFEIKVFNPISLKGNTHRMHSKLQITVDKTTGKTESIGGGTNLRDEYFGLAGQNFRDTDIYTSGTSAEQSLSYFKELWNHSRSKKPSGLDNIWDYFKWGADLTRRFRGATSKRVATESSMKQSSQNLDSALNGLKENKYLSLKETGRWAKGVREVGTVDFHRDDLETFEGSHNGVFDLLRKAKSSIKIQNPYLVFPEDLKKELKAAVDRGVKVEIVTSWKNADRALTRAGLILEQPWMAANGIDLYEYLPKHFLHKKTIVVDDKYVGIGSYNLDPRSKSLNHEVFYTFENEELAQKMARRFAADKSESRTIVDKRQLTGALGCGLLFQSVAKFFRNSL